MDLPSLQSVDEATDIEALALGDEVPVFRGNFAVRPYAHRHRARARAVHRRAATAQIDTERAHVAERIVRMLSVACGYRRGVTPMLLRSAQLAVVNRTELDGAVAPQ